jgi:hypothetical protein
MLILFRVVTATYSGSYEQCAAAYRDAQRHNLLFGWWSVASLVVNPLALFRNAQAFKRLKQLRV